MLVTGFNPGYSKRFGYFIRSASLHGSLIFSYLFLRNTLNYLSVGPPDMNGGEVVEGTVKRFVKFKSVEVRFGGGCGYPLVF